MPIQIHGKEYITVAERVQEAGENFVGLETEVLQFAPVVVIKATVTTKTGVYTGISAANPLKAIEKSNPYEVAETSAVGRALGFAGYGIVGGIASADEMIKAKNEEADEEFTREPAGEHICSQHDEPVEMKEGTSKTTGKKYYYHRNDENQICFGGGYK